MPKVTNQTKTDGALAAALLQLLKTRSFRKIKVADICQAAQTSRSGFYVHFEDKYHLLEYCLADIRKRLDAKNTGSGPRQRLLGILSYIYKNKSVFRNLFADDVNYEVLVVFQKHFKQFITDMLEVSGQDNQARNPEGLASIYHGGGITSSITWWIGDGFKTPPEEMAVRLYEMLRDVLPMAEGGAV